ncbi:MAG TPA: DNA polymerase III subunit gamma/tau [Candidatus Limnocylindrales bacterium]|nr:DNA polymerase III subunit gamma/tau [Candidatus Limnocylindrales bacterium]
MGTALYRKYRSKSLAEIVGQEHITTTLTKALESGRVSHAYLFSGPRGVGKTSIARILAHQLNGFEYKSGATYMDIIEIDAASNRRIDEVRDIRDKVYIAPTSGKYKVYIIDEVHMLTREAFNALLKTLEEPPAHAVFILATTEAHKLPETIVSRTQHYTFRPVDQADVIAHLKHIAEQEGIAIADDAVVLLAAHGEGSFRDSISLLDQASSLGSGTITKSDVERLLGIASDGAIIDLMQAVAAGQTAGLIMGQLQALYTQGLQASSIARQLSAVLRKQLSENSLQINYTRALSLMRQLLEVPASPRPERLLEIVLIDASAPSSNGAPASPASQQAAAPVVQPVKIPQASATPPKTQRPKPSSENTSPALPAVVVPPPAPQLVEAAQPTVRAVTGPEIARAVDDSSWPDILNSIKKEYNTLYGVLRMAKPVYGPDSIELQFKFAFHQKRLNEVKNRQIIADFVKQITGQDVSVQCTLQAATAIAMPTAAPVGAAPAMTSITDIFGGGEVIGT